MSEIDNFNENCEKQLKVVIAGHSSAGKTCILHRFCNEEFSCLYYPTAGVDFLLKRCVVQGDKHVRVVLWDIGGTELSNEMLSKYIYAAHAIMFVFDITNTKSFSIVSEWLNRIRPCLPEKPPVFGLLANKCDMEHQRAVPVDKQTRFACNNNMVLHNVSARTGENIMLCFQHIFTDIFSIRLTKAQKEEQHCVVRAEITTTNHNPVFAGHQTAPSTICCLQ